MTIPSTARVVLRAMVRGRVQGVSFRAFTEAEARRLGLTGWVRNVGDGSVEVLAEGERAALERLLAWLGRGPTHARVDEVVPTWLTDPPSHPDFRVARSVSAV